MIRLQNQPHSLRVAAILQMIAGAIGLLWVCVGLLNMFATFEQVSGVGIVTVTAGLGEFSIAFLLSIGQLVMGTGLLTTKRWSWLGTLILQGIINLIIFISMPYVSAVQLLNAVIAIGLFYLLMRSDTRSFFRSRSLS